MTVVSFRISPYKLLADLVQQCPSFRQLFATLHISTDLLCDICYEDCTIDTPLDDSMTQEQIQRMSAEVASSSVESTPVKDFLSMQVLIMQYGMAGMSILLTSPLPEPWKWGLMVGYLVALTYFVYQLLFAASAGYIDDLFIMGIIGSWLNTAIGGSLALASMLIIAAVLSKVSIELAKILHEWLPNRLKWGILGIAFNFMIVGLLLSIWVNYYEMILSREW